MSDKHIITAVFNGTACGSVDSRYQYDYGQVLRIVGVDLPEAFEAHFANSETDETITMIGSDNSVSVPDELLQTGEPVYCWIYLHDEATDGRTVYKIRIPVRRRPEITDLEPTPVEQSAITQAIAALDAAVEKCDDAVTHYPKIVNLVWYVWDAEAGDWVNTGIKAEGVDGIDGYTPIKGVDYFDGTDGVDGVSPVVTTEQTETGHRITITDADGSHSIDLYDGHDGTDGRDGVDGVSPIITVTESGGYRYVNVTDAQGTSRYRVLDGVSPIVVPAPITGGTRLTIYDAQGSRYADIYNGAKGDRGTDGFSPALYCHETTDGYQVEIRDVNGTQYFDLYNGADGQDGADGVDGADGADGTDGFSPTIGIETITGGYELTITDAQGTNVIDLYNGQDGADGVSPLVSTYATPTDDGYVVEIEDAAGTQSFTIYHGQDGDPGQDGVSPTATITKSGRTATITITDDNGTTTAQVSDGVDGTTPVRGTDYWTAADQAAIVSDVLDEADAKTVIVNKTSSDTAVTLEQYKFFVFPEMASLTVTCPATGGQYAFRFTSGATATTLTMTGIVMPDGFAVEANRVYEINVYQGYGLAVSWEVTA